MQDERSNAAKARTKLVHYQTETRIPARHIFGSRSTLAERGAWGHRPFVTVGPNDDALWSNCQHVFNYYRFISSIRDETMLRRARLDCAYAGDFLIIEGKFAIPGAVTGIQRKGC